MNETGRAVDAAGSLEMGEIEKTLDAKYGKGLNAAGEPRARQTLAINNVRMDVHLEFKVGYEPKEDVNDG